MARNKIGRGALSSGIFAWLAYDFINSIPIINGSLYYSPWLVAHGVNSAWYGFTFVVSTIILLAALPLFGALLDRRGAGVQLLLFVSIAMSAAGILLWRFGENSNPSLKIWGTLLAFGGINFAYQASFVPYNWLLVSLRGVRSQEDVRRVSGWGEGAGSLGSVVGALIGFATLRWLLKGEDARIELIGMLAILFLVLFFVDVILLKKGIDERVDVPEVKSLLSLLKTGFQEAKQNRELRFFLLSFFLYADGLLTVQLYLPIYMHERLGMSDYGAASAFAVSLSAAAVGAFMFGQYGQKAAPRMVIMISLALWTMTLISLGVVSAQSTFFGLMTVAGALFGTLWSASRAYLISLTPQSLLGRTLGFYSIFERCASIVGPSLWAGMMLIGSLQLRARYMMAFDAMAGLLVLSIIALSYGRRRVVSTKLVTEE